MKVGRRAGSDEGREEVRVKMQVGVLKEARWWADLCLRPLVGVETWMGALNQCTGLHITWWFVDLKFCRAAPGRFAVCDCVDGDITLSATRQRYVCACLTQVAKLATCETT